MTDLFLNLVNTSLSAGILVLAVVILRLLLKQAPKWIACALWGLVAIRLLCPISLESVFSLIPEPVSTGTVTQQFWNDYAGGSQIYRNDTPQFREAVDAGLEPQASGDGAYYVVTDDRDHLKPPATRKEALVPTLTAVWATGMVILGIYALVSYLRLRKRVSPSLVLRENIYLCDYIETPFILGLFRPRIYLPSGLDNGSRVHVIAHEQAHLARYDHWWKPLGYALLCLHWFNPLLWLAYVLLCRDIELACDEKVIRQLGGAEKKSYSEALLECSMPRYWVAACPLAFGEVGVKERVKTVLNYKKPAFWVVLLAVTALIITAVCFLTDPPVDDPVVIAPSPAGHSFIATVEGILEKVIMVAPAENTPEAASADYIAVRIPAGTESLRVGDTVRIVYSGSIQETYPAQITDTVSIVVLRDLTHLPENYHLNQAILDGCVAMVDGDVAANQHIWQEFMDQVAAGNPAQVRYLTYYTIGNPDRMSQELFQESRSRYPAMYIHDLTYDGESFTLRWFEGETEYVQNWKYLMHYEGVSENPNITFEAYDCYVLTDRNDVTYQELWNGMVSADFRDQIPFKEVYTDRIYADEPTLADLNKAMRALEPYMLNYSIASLDANELTGRLDIEVREWKDGLFDLIGQFIDPHFVVVTELRGEIEFTGTLQERYPEYFGLSGFKGLELYVLPGGNCVLMEGTNRIKTEAEIAALPPAALEEMRQILAEYDIPAENIFIDNRSDMTESAIRRALGIMPECKIWLELRDCSATGAQVFCHIENLGDGAVWTGYDYRLEMKTDSGWVYYGYPSEDLAWEDALQFHTAKHDPVTSINAIGWEEHWSRVADAPLPPGTYRYCHSITLEQDGRTLSQTYYAEFTVS